MALFTFDFDGTLTRYPERFAPLVNAITASGNQAAVVTARASDEGIAEFLQENRFPDMPVHARGNSLFPGNAWKARTLQQLGSTMHFDDDETVDGGGIPILRMPKGTSSFGEVRTGRRRS